MPRIDPLQLLKCLSVLLSPEGGIMSREEVPRLVNLMTKFSKKLVSKCVYLLILKNTDVNLVDMFMTSGGWLLIHTWLQEAMTGSNWNLVKEILELLLITPVNSARLRLNNIPKLVKTLSKRKELGDVKEMAALLVNNWLAIVKSSASPAQDNEKSAETSPKPVIEEKKEEVKIEENGDVNVTNEIETVELQEAPVIEEEPPKAPTEEDEAISPGMFYKITVRDGKQVITKMSNSEETEEKTVEETDAVAPEKLPDKKEDKSKEDAKSKSSSSKSKSSSSSSSSSSSKKSSSSSSRSSSSSSKDKDRRHSSSSRHSSKSSSSSSKDKDRTHRDKDKENNKDKHRNNGSSKHSSSKSSSSSKDKDKKDSKEKQSEKDNDTLAKIKPVSIDKIGRIPKKSSTNDDKDKDNKKKPSISIEPRKKGEDRPKTVKIFNSKMRSTGLEEEAKPPPPRNAVKKPTPVIPPVLPTKRTSPIRDIPATPPEKKMKIDVPERAGAIKLIPPKPKPAVLLESDIFMDALTAATSKKEPKKRKRRLSVSKDSPENSPTVQPPATAAAASPIALKSFSPANFYQDTLETSESNNKTAKDEKMDVSMEEKEETKDETPCEETCESNEPSTRTNSDGLKGVLVHLKKKGPKRSIRWRDDKDLVEIKYFELDETERVNVSRTNFTDMAKLEMTHEREALMGRKLANEDLMEPTTLWRALILVDRPTSPVQPGCKSLEKDIQYAREKNSLQALYFNKSMIPDSAAEPIPETHPMVDPVTIPLEDPESQVYDLRNTPWPEPKTAPPVEQPPANMPAMFPNIPGPFPNFPQLPPQGFPNIPPGPGFCPPNMLTNGPPNMMPNNNLNMMNNPNMPIGMDMMNQGPMPPMFGPAGPNMDNYNAMMGDNQNFPMQGFNQNMFGPPNSFNNMDRGAHRGRGGVFRGRGHSNNWGRNNGQRGGGTWRSNTHQETRLCKNVRNHGYCRNIETCRFVHPNN